MRPPAHRKIAADPYPLALKMIEFFDEGRRVDDDPISNQAQCAAVEDAGWNEVEHECPAIVDDGMSGIRSALIAHDDIRFTGQDVDNLAFAFIPPLGADDHGLMHVGFWPFQLLVQKNSTDYSEPEPP